MKKKSYLILSIFLSIFIVTSIKAAGSAPSVYNSDAKSLLEMLWAKLDEAIVSNYNVSVLLRYHDHEGFTGDGSFVTKGLPIGTNGIENGAITSAKLSTVAKTRVANTLMGDIDAGVNKEIPVFIVTNNTTITAISIVSDFINRNDTDYTTFSTSYWYNGSPAIMHSVNTKVSGGQAFTGAFRPITFTYGITSNPVYSGSTVTFKKTDSGAGRAVTNLAITIEYTISE